MSQSTLNPPPARSWRDIPQPATPVVRTMSREGKKRLAMSIANIVGLVMVLGAAGWGVFEVFQLWRNEPTRLTAPTKGAPIRDFSVRTDGVLDQAWVRRTLDLPKAASLMELDLAALKSRLEESGQVSKAVLERRFPDVLAVTLQERVPVARIMALMGEAAPVSFMVSRDGTVYSGFGYDVAMAGALPFIDGVKLVRDGSGFERIEGMDAVADLLGTAQASAPALYRSFKVVSLARFDADRTLVVKSSEVESIVFGATADSFFRQIARLDYILEETRRQESAGKLKSVNLAVGDRQVPISFETIQRESSRQPAAAARSGPVPAGASLFFIPPRNSSSTKRDF